MSPVRKPRQRGFSLVEAVVAIVIMSVISIGLVDFIANSAEGYAVTAARNQVSASGRVVLDRLAMELHNALPESVRISAVNLGGVNGNQCLEFIPVLAATTYIDPAFRPAAFKTTFTVVNFAPNALTYPTSNLYAVVYPTSADDLYNASFTSNATEAIARVTVADADSDNANRDKLTTHIAGDPNTTYNHRFRRQSSVERLFLTEQPVSFCVVGNKLYRYANYGFTASQRTPYTGTTLPTATPNRVLITDQVDNSALTGGVAGEAFDQPAVTSRRRNAVMQLELNFSQGGQEVRLNHEILQQTTP